MQFEVNIYFKKYTIFIICFLEIRLMVKNVGAPHRETIKAIEKKLEICRNQENNPDSDMCVW